MLILGKHKISARNPLKSLTPFAMAAFVVCASPFSVSVLAQSSAESASGSVTVQTGDTSLAAPPSIGAQLGEKSKAAEMFAPVTKANTPKIYTKPISNGPTEMDLRQL